MARGEPHARPARHHDAADLDRALAGHGRDRSSRPRVSPSAGGARALGLGLVERAQRPHRAVQAVEQLRRQVVAAIDDLRRARVGGARLALLGVGERHRAQREDLVDLGGVEEIARALGRDLRVVREDDRRREQERRIALGAREHGPAAHVLARRRGCARPFGRVGQRDEAAVLRPRAAGAARRTTRAAPGRAARRGPTTGCRSRSARARASAGADRRSAATPDRTRPASGADSRT